jgi:uncharacterized membrane protein
MKNFLFIIGVTIVSIAFTPLVLAHGTEYGEGLQNTTSCGSSFWGGGFGMMNGGIGMGWGYGIFGLLLHLILWIGVVALTVYIARKVWDASGTKK